MADVPHLYFENSLWRCTREGVRTTGVGSSPKAAWVAFTSSLIGVHSRGQGRTPCLNLEREKCPM